MGMEGWPQAVVTEGCNGGTPCAVKAACTVWSGGKARDHFKGLPITITSYADCAGFGGLYLGPERSGAPRNVLEKAVCDGAGAEKLRLRE